MGEGKPPTLRDKLEQTIDITLDGCKDFDSFIAAMKSAGCEVKQSKHLAFKTQGQERFIRCKSLGDDYTEGAIRERVSSSRIVEPKKKAAVPPRYSSEIATGQQPRL